MHLLERDGAGKADGNVRDPPHASLPAGTHLRVHAILLWTEPTKRSQREYSPARRSQRPIGRTADTSQSSLRYRPRAKTVARRAAPPMLRFARFVSRRQPKICESREPKGHCANVRSGDLAAFTGIGNDYKPPEAGELAPDTSRHSASKDIRRDRKNAMKTGILFDEVVDLTANIRANRSCWKRRSRGFS
jgi:hypothetical protein